MSRLAEPLIGIPIHSAGVFPSARIALFIERDSLYSTTYFF